MSNDYVASDVGNLWPPKTSPVSPFWIAFYEEACSSLCYKHRTATGTRAIWNHTPGIGDIPAITPAN